MAREMRAVWPEPEEDPRLRARRESVAEQARKSRLRMVGIGLLMLGSIVLLGTLGGLAGTFIAWLFGVGSG